MGDCMNNKKNGRIITIDTQNSNSAVFKRVSLVAAGVLMVIIIVLGFSGCAGEEKEPVSKAALNEYPLVEDRNVAVKTENEETSFSASEEPGGDISVDRKDISENALIYTYTTKNEVTMQVIFVLTSDGSLRVGLNTSEECKGEPDSYFIPGEGVFKCAHCGRVVSAAEVGRGTNIGAPAEISFSEEDDLVVIKESDLLASESYFTNWKGPIE